MLKAFITKRCWTSVARTPLDSHGTPLAIDMCLAQRAVDGVLPKSAVLRILLVHGKDSHGTDG